MGNEKKLTFGRGLKSNYFIGNDGEWDSSLFSEVVYFAVDTHQIFLNGVSYGLDNESETELAKRYDATRLRMGDDCHVGGILRDCRSVGDATAIIDDSLTWQKFDGVDLSDDRVRFSVVEKHRDDDNGGCLEFCPSTHSIRFNGVIYRCEGENSTEGKEKEISVNKMKEILENLCEILELDEKQREKLRLITDSL